jgi:hypothetical protein
MLHHTVNERSTHILFIYTGMIGNAIIHCTTQNQSSDMKFVEINKNTGQHKFVDCMAKDTQSLSVPILSLEQSSTEF